MGNKLVELIFGYRKRVGGQPELTTAIKLDGQHFEAHKAAGTPEGSLAEATIAKTAGKAGFQFITARRAFVTTGKPDRTGKRITTGAEAAELVDAFIDQGYDVRVTGLYSGGRVLTEAESRRQSGVAREADRITEALRREKRESDREARNAGRNRALSEAVAREASGPQESNVIHLDQRRREAAESAPARAFGR